MKGKFLRKVISLTMSFAMTAGIMCIGTVSASAAEVDVAPLIATNSLTNNSTISSTLISKGESVTVNAKASGGKGGYTYAVLYKKKAEKDWTVRQGYKDNDNIVVRPAKAADYSICVKVKDENGVIAKKFFSVSVKDYVQEVIRLVNEERKKAGLAPLKQNTALAKAAAKRAEEITENFSHTRPDGTLCFSVFNEYDIDNWGGAENIAWGQSTPQAVMNTWMNSEGHRDNILSSYMTDIGVGLCEKNGTKYRVQVFIMSPS